MARFDNSIVDSLIFCSVKASDFKEAIMTTNGSYFRCSKPVGLVLIVVNGRYLDARQPSITYLIFRFPEIIFVSREITTFDPSK